MRHRKLALALIIAAVLGTAALSLVYEDWSFLSRARPPLRVAVDVWVGFAPLYLAQDRGYFKARGVEVELKKMKGAQEIRAALAAGKIDGQTTSLDTILMQVDQGIPSVAVLLLDRSQGGDGIVARAGVRTVAGLRGKTVAYQPATPSHFFLAYHLFKAGMKLTDVKGRKMDSGDAGAAFMAGKVDAAVTWEPWLTRASTGADSHLLVSSAVPETVIVDVLAFRPGVLRDRGKEVRAVVAAWNDAVKYWQKNPAAANKIMAAHYGLKTAEFTDMISGLRFLDREQNLKLMGSLDSPGPMLDLVSTINKIFLKNRVIRTAHALPEILAVDYLR